MRCAVCRQRVTRAQVWIITGVINACRIEKWCAACVRAAFPSVPEHAHG